VASLHFLDVASTPPHEEGNAVSLFEDGFGRLGRQIPLTILRMSTQATTQQATLQHPSRVSLRANVGQVLCVIVPPIIWFAPLDIEAGAKHALAITSFMLLAWITEAMDYAVAGLIGCYLYWALKVAPFNVAFGGFATDTPWFLMGALLFGMMATKSGLARRVAFLVTQRVGNSYSGILLGLIITDFLLTFIVPSGVARIVIMASVALGLVEAFGMGPGSNVGRGLFLITTYCAGLFDKMIIAGASSITARGLIERAGGVHVLWSKWFLAYLPCTLITILVAWRLTLRLYPPEKLVLADSGNYLRSENQKIGPWTSLEKKAAFFSVVAMALFLSDFFHGITPSIIGLGIGLAALLPVVGVLTIEDLKRMNYLPVFFVATAISMGDVLVQSKGLNLLTNFMFDWMEPLLTNAFSSTLVLYWTGFVYHFFLASEISMLATSMPLLMDFAKSHGLSPLMLGMVWSFSAAGKIFVYQSAVMIVGYSYGFFAGKDLLRMGLLLTVVESLILLLLVPYYWPLLGIQ
jgi:solute carrier family 13 (sodium-dependent dicarboxylate transporter), member 2/3/5